MSDHYASKGILWYEGWNALNDILKQHNLLIVTGERETFVIIMDHAMWLAYVDHGMKTNIGERSPLPLPPMIERNSFAEAVTFAVNEMIARINRERQIGDE